VTVGSALSSGRSFESLAKRGKFNQLTQSSRLDKQLPEGLLTMRLQRISSVLAVLAVSSFAVPAFLSAQTNGAGDEPQVRITLLPSGDIQVSGDFVLEDLSRGTRVRGTNVVVREDLRLTDFRDGLVVETPSFLVEAASGSVTVGNEGNAPHFVMRDARISRTQ
jgi:hypothetical protein